ncbi:DUF3408 domain-containing protein [uncultured Duncaniella sp.]|uniref:DUF3408 domain-containing protein n=1 Tax=uncultured Duncaniella sp. TaxID=2768039 RepID=UPI0025A9E474|nr:DUF3408 domain-containing protein [uncultured Duncaniella sp.]
MARKRESGFDADGFLDAYEENSRNTSPPEQPAEISEKATARPACDIAAEALSDRELDYMEKFILQKRYSRISRKGKQVSVSEDFKIKIQKLMLFFSDGGSITEYVNNVLEQHFKEYDDIIKRMFNNSLKF